MNSSLDNQTMNLLLPFLTKNVSSDFKAMGQETEAPALTPWNAPNAFDTVVAGQKDLGNKK
jgi:hypothetical protein